MTDQPRGSGFSTLAIHAGLRSEPAANADMTAIFETGGFAPDAATAAVFDRDLHPLGPIEANGAHPTTAMLEERIAALEGGSAAVAVATGAAAQILALHTLMRPGEELVAARSADASRPPFESFGWQVKPADAGKPETFVEALSDRTKAILIQSLAQPGGVVIDIEAIATVARRARVPLIVDNTLATPYLVRPFEHGADIIIHSATRMLAGHDGAAGGVIVDGGVFDWLQDERYPSLSKPQPIHGEVPVGEAFGNFAFAVACRGMAARGLGPAMSPFAALLVLNGIETLALRMQRHSDNALAVAQHLARHSAVASVRYAGLVDDPGHELALRYCPNGAGGLLSFGLSAGGDTAILLAEKLRMFSRSSEYGAARSVVIYPASDRWDIGGRKGVADIDPSVVFVSIGLEDAADIIADLDQALGV